jgi:hypothetical protein
LRFYKSFLDLNIKIKEVAVKVKKNNSKILVNNKYVPLNINLVNNKSLFNQVIKLLKSFNSVLSKMIKKHNPQDEVV